MFVSFLTGFSYGVGLGAIVCVLFRLAVSVREIPADV